MRLEKYDIFGLQETWDVDTDYCLEYFTNHILYLCKAKLSLVGGRSMGGVVVGVKHNIAKYIIRIVYTY